MELKWIDISEMLSPVEIPLSFFFPDGNEPEEVSEE